MAPKHLFDLLQDRAAFPDFGTQLFGIATRFLAYARKVRFDRHVSLIDEGLVPL